MRGAGLAAADTSRGARGTGNTGTRLGSIGPGLHGTAPPPDQDAPSFLPCRISALLRRPPAGATSTARPGILPCPVPLISVLSSDRGPRTSRIARVIDKEDLS